MPSSLRPGSRRHFLVPVVAGILFSYTLRPLVSALERARLPRLAATSLVMLSLIALVSASFYAIRGEFNDAWPHCLPRHASCGISPSNAARSSPGPVTNMKAAAVRAGSRSRGGYGQDRTRRSACAQRDVATPGLDHGAIGPGDGDARADFHGVPLTFFLLAREIPSVARSARLAGESLWRRRVTVEVLNEIDTQIQRYMATLLITNVLIAALTWAALAMLALPNAGMWGVVTGVLHIIPYAGTVIAAGAVGVAALVEWGTLGDAMLAVGAVILIAEAIGLGFATWLQGRSAQMNPVATFVGVLFFGWLWGAWGLLLGMPILAVMKTIADRVEAMKPLSEMLGR